jgi:uncharacterized protein GlcG (DUF336 family)
MREFQRAITAAVIGIATLNIVPAGAQGLLPAPRISAALANEAVGAAVASCAAQGYAETAVLLDTDGVVQASLRGDNAGIHAFDSAHDKAYTAVTFKRDTMPQMSAQPRESDVLMMRLPHLLRAGGGVVIKVGSVVVGAIGASGAPGFQYDDACAKAGIAKIIDRLK